MCVGVCVSSSVDPAPRYTHTHTQKQGSVVVWVVVKKNTFPRMCVTMVSKCNYLLSVCRKDEMLVCFNFFVTNTVLSCVSYSQSVAVCIVFENIVARCHNQDRCDYKLEILKLRQQNNLCVIFNKSAMLYITLKNCVMVCDLFQQTLSS